WKGCDFRKCAFEQCRISRLSFVESGLDVSLINTEARGIAVAGTCTGKISVSDGSLTDLKIYGPAVALYVRAASVETSRFVDLEARLETSEFERSLFERCNVTGKTWDRVHFKECEFRSCA